MRVVVDTNILVRALLNPEGKFLEIAVAGRADVIVTADEDLEVLDPFEGIPMIKPSEFLRLLRQSLESES